MCNFLYRQFTCGFKEDGQFHRTRPYRNGDQCDDAKAAKKDCKIVINNIKPDKKGFYCSKACCDKAKKEEKSNTKRTNSLLLAAAKKDSHDHCAEGRNSLKLKPEDIIKKSVK